MSTNPAPICPKFIPAEGGGNINSTSKFEGIRFSLVSYNILAQVSETKFPIFQCDYSNSLF